VSSTPWFKFFPGDYLADTRRLSQRQHGAYMLLMLDYYSTGEPPPNDDVELSRITQSDSVSDWKLIRSAIEKYFEVSDGLWRHKRIEVELAARSAEHRKKRDGAIKANKIRWGASDTESDTESVKHRNTRSQKSEVRSQRPKPDKSTSKTLRTDSLKTLSDLGVDEQHARDWLAVRKAKRAPLTPTALKSLEREAANANISIADAVQIAAENNWQGFKASWLINYQRAGTLPAHSKTAQTIMALQRLKDSIT
jgi:uncharacterized protein YdaU (DUF1376 family)